MNLHQSIRIKVRFLNLKKWHCYLYISQVCNIDLLHIIMYVMTNFTLLSLCLYIIDTKDAFEDENSQ